MNLHTRFQIDNSRVVHETIEGETIIIDLENGNYYSVAKVGATIWDCIANGATQCEIIETIMQLYDVTCPDVEHAVNQLTAELQQENLISPDDTDGSENRRDSSQVGTSSEISKRDFEPPILHKYTDMQALLLLDPIHEVNEAGWPNPDPNRPKTDN